VREDRFEAWQKLRPCSCSGSECSSCCLVHAGVGVGLAVSLIHWGNRSNGHRFAHRLARGALPLLGVRYHVEGEENLLIHQPCVYVANHQTDADVVVYGNIYPPNTVVIGKTEISRIPLFGLFFKASGNICCTVMITTELFRKWKSG